MSNQIFLCFHVLPNFGDCFELGFQSLEPNLLLLRVFARGGILFFQGVSNCVGIELVERGVARAIVRALAEARIDIEILCGVKGGDIGRILHKYGVLILERAFLDETELVLDGLNRLMVLFSFAALFLIDLQQMSFDSRFSNASFSISRFRDPFCKNAPAFLNLPFGFLFEQVYRSE